MRIIIVLALSLAFTLPATAQQPYCNVKVKQYFMTDEHGNRVMRFNVTPYLDLTRVRIVIRALAVGDNKNNFIEDQTVFKGSESVLAIEKQYYLMPNAVTLENGARYVIDIDTLKTRQKVQFAIRHHAYDDVLNYRHIEVQADECRTYIKSDVINS